MKMRRIATVLFAGMLLYGGGAAWQAWRSEPAVDLVAVFRGTGATLVEVTVDTWCQVPQPVESAVAAGKILQAALTGMGLGDAGPIQLEELETGEGVDQVITREARVELQPAESQVLFAAVQSMAAGDEQDTYLILSLYDRTDNPDLKGMYALLTRGVAALGLRADKSTQLVGVVDGRLSPEQTADIVTQVMAGTEAEMKSLYSEGPLVSVSGYSDKVAENTSTIIGQVNVNLALRYNEREGRTWIFLGCPSIWESI